MSSGLESWRMLASFERPDAPARAKSGDEENENARRQIESGSSDTTRQRCRRRFGIHPALQPSIRPHARRLASVVVFAAVRSGVLRNLTSTA
jgi:hypothetical protein